MGDDTKAVITSGPATDGSLREFMEGEEFARGGRHDLEDRGMGSGIEQTNHQAHVEEPGIAPAEPDFVQGQTPTEGQDFQRLYGQSENEKGELRKNVTELTNATTQLLQQVQAQQQQITALQSGQGYPQPPGTGQQYQQPAPNANFQLPETYFPGEKPTDVVEFQHVDALVKEVLAPTVRELASRQAALDHAQIQAQKLAAGIGIGEEQRLATTYPWLTGYPDGPQKIEAMRYALQQERVQAPPSPATPQPATPQQAAVAAQPAARRVTYVETGTGKTVTPADDVPLQQRFAQELAEAKARGGSEGMRKVFEKYGMETSNDFGPGVYSR